MALGNLFSSPSLNRPRGPVDPTVFGASPGYIFWPNFSSYNGQKSRVPCRKRALIVAIEYLDGQTFTREGGSMRLHGCYADADDMRELLESKGGYCREDIRVLADLPGLPDSQRPTRDNILEGIRWLTEGCAPGDRRFFHYAGHGAQADDLNGDEKDGKDEAIQPLDWATTYNREDRGLIIDDALRSELVDPLPKGSTLTAVFDCCHSGTILDMDQEFQAYVHGSNKQPGSRGFLPPKFPTSFRLKWPNYRGIAARPVGNILDLPELAEVKDPDEPKSSRTECDLTMASEDAALKMINLEDPTKPAYKSVEANVVCWSACLDTQFAWDRPVNKRSERGVIVYRRGVLTAAFTSGLRGAAANYNAMPGGFHTDQREATYAELFNYIIAQERKAYRERMISNLDTPNLNMVELYVQTPQLWISVAMGKIMDRPVEL